MSDYIARCWVGWACAAAGASVLSFFGCMAKKYRKMQRRQQATELGVQALLRAQIIHIYNKYMDRGELPIYERENIDGLIKQYVNLGGNGIVPGLVERLYALPTPIDHHDE